MPLELFQYFVAWACSHALFTHPHDAKIHRYPVHITGNAHSIRCLKMWRRQKFSENFARQNGFWWSTPHTPECWQPHIAGGMSRNRSQNSCYSCTFTLRQPLWLPFSYVSSGAANYFPQCIVSRRLACCRKFHVTFQIGAPKATLKSKARHIYFKEVSL